MNGLRTSARSIAQLRRQIDARQRVIVEQVAELRLMSGRQIEALHFQADAGVSAASAARQCRRTLSRLVEQRLLHRLDRRVGGIRAGSASFVYGLGPVGHRLLELDVARPRPHEPGSLFVDHQLAVAQLFVDVSLAASAGQLELLEVQGEPACWRSLPSHGRTVLRPDIYLALARDELEYRWFVELDRGTVHLPAVLRKARLYETYYRCGVEQAAHDVFPRVLWVVPGPKRAEQLRALLAPLPIGLMLVCTVDQALDVLGGGQP
jgi:hypothetical protein